MAVGWIDVDDVGETVCVGITSPKQEVANGVYAGTSLNEPTQIINKQQLTKILVCMIASTIGILWKCMASYSTFLKPTIGIAILECISGGGRGPKTS